MKHSLKAQSSSSKRLLRFAGPDQGLTLHSIDGGDSSSKKSRGMNSQQYGGSDTNKSNFSKMSGKVRIGMQTIDETAPYGDDAGRRAKPMLGQVAMEKRW